MPLHGLRPDAVSSVAGGGHIRFGHFAFTVPPWLARHLGAGGPLESWTLAGVVAAVGVVCVVVGFVIRRRRGHVYLRRVLWSSRAMFTIGALAAPVAVAMGVNAYAGYVPSVAAAVDLVTGRTAAGIAGPGSSSIVWHGSVSSATSTGAPAVLAASSGVLTSSVQDLPLPSPALGMPNGNAYVYLPPGFDPRRRYPVLYLLGGAPGAPSDWLYAGNVRGTADALVRQGYVHPFIIVMPRISPSWGTDYEGLNAVHGPQVMTYLTRVVIPAIDSRYPTVASRSGRALAGFSAGADASLNIALHNQSMVGAAAAIEPQGKPGAGAAWVLAHDARLIWQNSPIDYIPSSTFAQPMAFYLSAGSSRTSGPVPTLARELRARGQTVAVHNENGLGHTWVDARNDLPYLLQFVSEAFGYAAHP